MFRVIVLFCGLTNIFNLTGSRGRRDHTSMEFQKFTMMEYQVFTRVLEGIQRKHNSRCNFHPSYAGDIR
jgi:hypothetical protein